MTFLRRCGSVGMALGATMAIAACGGSSSGGGGGGGGGGGASGSGPITIGASLSLSGDFAADGQAFERGYQLWVADQNAKGGLLGHKIKLDVLSDSSSPSQIVTNYQKLIGSNKDQLVFGPFSTLLTVPSARVAARYGYAFVEGAGAGPAVFGTGLHNVFSVQIPVVDELVSYAKWIASLPAGQRPKSAAYVTVNDPFTQPQLPVAQKILQAAGVKTVINKVFPEEEADYTSIAGQVASDKPDLVILGSVDVPTVSAFTHVFIQQHYDPKQFIATAGPDQGAQFVKAVGSGNQNGISVPGVWFGGFKQPTSQQMVKEYVAKYGGTASDVNADVAEAYSVGQVVAQAVQATHSLNNTKLISYLHSGATFNTVIGAAKFNAKGENTIGQSLIFQWQNGKLVQTLPASAPGSVAPQNPKPAWGS